MKSELWHQRKSENRKKLKLEFRFCTRIRLHLRRTRIWHWICARGMEVTRCFVANDTVDECNRTLLKSSALGLGNVACQRVTQPIIACRGFVSIKNKKQKNKKSTLAAAKLAEPDLQIFGVPRASMTI